MPEDRDKEKETKKTSSAARRRASSKKKQAERRKVVESGGGRSAKEDKPRKSRKPRPEPKKKAVRRRPADREPEERPKRSKRRPAAAPARRARRDRKPEPVEPIGELTEPKEPPEANLDLMGELYPVWEPGLPVGGGLCLLSVGLAVAALLTTSESVSALTVIGLLLLLVAISIGGVGVLARKIWGYVIGIGAAGLGTLAGLLWGMYAVVQPDLNPWLPLGFFLSNLLAVLALYQMRWGPGPMADERERYRSMKRHLTSFTTAHGELAHSAAFGAILATVIGGLLLVGANTARSEAPSLPANFSDGMSLDSLEEPPEEGTVVLARWGTEDYFFLGRVDQARGDDEFHVTYLDGDEAWVRLSDLRRDTVRTGASVHIHLQGHEGWLPATITQRSGSRVEADVGATERVWVPLAMVRVREL